MTARYRQLVDRLRSAFPAPVSDPVHDGYVVFSILRALDRVDALKSQAPLLGHPAEPDFAAARRAALTDQPHSVEETIAELVDCLQGMPIWGHPRSQVNVIATASIPSLVGVVLPAMYNPNLCSEESGRGFSEAEARAAAITARLVGYDPQRCGGLFTFGGAGTLLYGLKIGLEKALPGAIDHGLRDDVVVLASEQGHYACANAAGWLGIGRRHVLKARSHRDNSIDLEDLERLARAAHAAGQRIAAFVATLGSTDAFGLDDVRGVVALRDRLVAEWALDYTPHVHADSVIGWAWSVFRDYPFDQNPLGFRGRTVRSLAALANRLAALPLADSLGVDFHKTGFAPYISSLVLVREQADLALLEHDRQDMPYIFHSGEQHPGMFTLETSRSAAGPMTALASLLLLGRDGFRALLGHAVDMAVALRELIGARPELSVVNDENHGPVTLFRAYPTGVDTFTLPEREARDPALRDDVRRHNELNRRIFQRVQAEALAGRGVAIGFTECYRRTAYGEPLAAMKSYVLSPFADESQLPAIVEHVLAAHRQVEAET